jgi:hypothetical protein
LLLHPLSPRGETHSIAGEGGTNSDEGTEIPVLYIGKLNPSTPQAICICIKNIMKCI